MSNTNPTKHLGWTQVLRNKKQLSLYYFFDQHDNGEAKYIYLKDGEKTQIQEGALVKVYDIYEIKLKTKKQHHRNSSKS
jgi:hypothetical protein